MAAGFREKPSLYLLRRAAAGALGGRFVNLVFSAVVFLPLALMPPEIASILLVKTAMKLVFWQISDQPVDGGGNVAGQ